MIFNILTASFLNIVLVQKNISELALKFERLSVNIQIEIASLSYLSKPSMKGKAIAPGNKQRTKKQMTTIKQDFACLISRRDNFILVKFSSAATPQCWFGERANFRTIPSLFWCKQTQ